MVTPKPGRQLHRLIAAASAAVLLLVGCDPFGPPDERAVPAYLVPLADVPLATQRLAADLLEELRGSPLADDPGGPGWDAAVLWPYAVAMQRPDVAGVAYFEFALVARDLAAPDAVRALAWLEDGGERFDRGSIVVSTGPHDHPIAVWSTVGPPIAAELASFAAARGERLETIYRLDVAAYVGESDEGGLVAAIGPDLGARVAAQVPLARVDGVDATWPSLPQEEFGITRVTTVPTIGGSPVDAAALDDGAAGDVVHEVEVEGPSSSPLAYAAWADWPSLRAGYRDAYGPLLEVLAQDAAQDWEIVDWLVEGGSGLASGRRAYVPVLHEPYDVAVTGAGASSFAVTVVDRQGAPDLLHVDALDGPEGAELELAISYPGLPGEERLRFFLARVLPEPGAVAPTFVTPEPWSDWTFATAAGDHAAQRLYEQFPYGGCASGCGPTAWAMLFGWADLLAAQRSDPWTPRWGLYRRDGGGPSAPDAVAPRTMEPGPRQVMIEVRQAVLTVCVGDNGPTLPSLMPFARAYLDGRTLARLSASYNGFGIRTDGLRDEAVVQIADLGRAVVVGTGFLQHYAVAYKYAVRYRLVRDSRTKQVVYVGFDRRFYVNQGWGGYRNGYIPAKTWFVGKLRPS